MRRITLAVLFAAILASGTGFAQTAPPVPAAKSRTLYISLIEDLRSAGKTHAALAHLDAFDKLYPASGAAAILRGDCLTDLARYPEAAAVYRRWLKGPEAAPAHAGLGRVEALSGRWDVAAGHYAQAVALAPTAAAYLNDYGFALLRAGRPQDALFRLRQAAELAPGDTKVRGNLVLALAAAGDQAGARRMLAGIADEAQRRELEAELARLTPR